MSEGEGGAGEAIGIDEVMRRLPHRPPFLMIDRAVDYQAGKSIRGIKCVTMGEPFFAGHFPRHPVMPGVLLIEAMAQSGGLLMSKTLDVDAEKNVILFMSVDNARFRRPVRPGDTLVCPVEVIYGRMGVYKFRGRAEVDGEVAAECEFAAMKAGV